jgi:hypothetical protein
MILLESENDILQSINYLNDIIQTFVWLQKL